MRQLQKTLLGVGGRGGGLRSFVLGLFLLELTFQGLIVEQELDLSFAALRLAAAAFLLAAAPLSRSGGGRGNVLRGFLLLLLDLVQWLRWRVSLLLRQCGRTEL